MLSNAVPFCGALRNTFPNEILIISDDNFFNIWLKISTFRLMKACPQSLEICYSGSCIFILKNRPASSLYCIAINYLPPTMTEDVIAQPQSADKVTLIPTKLCCKNEQTISNSLTSSLLSEFQANIQITGELVKYVLSALCCHKL